MKQISYRSLITVALFILIAAGGYFLYQKNNIMSKKIQGSNLPDILFFTNPVNEFTGIIDKISGNSIWISGKYTITPPPTPPNNPTAIPGQLITVPPLPPFKKFTYKVNIASYTLLNRPVTPIIYLFNKNTPTPIPPLTINDLKTGQLITVYTTSDLRSLKQNEFDAHAVKLGPVNNIISGKITDINIRDGVIILKAIPPVKPSLDQFTPSPKELEYSISISSDTEISRPGISVSSKADITTKPSEPIKFQLSELKTDILIKVYSDQDITDIQKVKALRIEPPANYVPAQTLIPSKESTSSSKH